MDENFVPAFTSIQGWERISGMKRSMTYQNVASGKLKAIKSGKSILIDVHAGLAWLRSLPPAQIRQREPQPTENQPAE